MAVADGSKSPSSTEPGTKSMCFSAMVRRIDAARVDAARHFAALVLVVGEPAGERFRFAGMAEAKESGSDERAVADPGALVGARAGLQRGAVAVDEEVGEVGSDRVIDDRI